MRITQNMMTGNSLTSVTRAFERFAEAQQRVSTGKQLTKPSDDPAGVQESLGFRRAMDHLAQFQRNLDYAHGFMSASESALGEAATMLRRARTLGLQGATDGINVEARTGLANQVASLIQQLGQIGNAVYGTRYLFGGQRTTEAPFLAGGDSGFIYRGGTTAKADDKLVVEITEGETLTINVTGDRVFEAAFATLARLHDHIATGQISLISNEDLAALDAALNDVTTLRAEFGAKMQRVEQTQQQLERTRLSYIDSLSRVEDADYARAILDLKTAETAYQSALAASVRGFEQSLLEFLR